MFYFYFLQIFGFNKEFKTQKTFKIMFVLSICECTILITDPFITIGGYGDIPVPDCFEILVNLHLDLWATAQWINFVLAYNRLATVALSDWRLYNHILIYYAMYVWIAGQYVFYNVFETIDWLRKWYGWPKLSKFQRSVVFEVTYCK